MMKTRSQLGAVHEINVKLEWCKNKNREKRCHTSDTMMSICLLSFRRVFISCSGSLWIPTQQPFTKILVALKEQTQIKLYKFNKDLQQQKYMNSIAQSQNVSLVKRVDFNGVVLPPIEQDDTHSAIAAGEISSRFSMLHSSKNSRMGDGWDPTEM